MVVNLHSMVTFQVEGRNVCYQRRMIVGGKTVFVMLATSVEVDGTGKWPRSVL